MTRKDFMDFPEETGAVSRLLPPLPRVAACKRVGVYLSHEEHAALRKLSLELEAATGTRLPATTLLRLGFLAIRPRLETAIRDHKQLGERELVELLLSPPAAAE